ncbi:MAG: phosphoenolpyruvate--protein phosphotransferase [Neomegalonema sp.]|nr:phosphoenolpyruvate--protein phosphotransferase [Neomegalonema sp.]
MSYKPHQLQSGASTRAMLRQLRETMAKSGRGDDRLRRITRLIATNMVAEVCSLYMLNPSDELVLIANEGLNPNAPELARLHLGQGLVGRIAQTGEPINTDQAQSTPGFQFVPGIGEEIYQSFLGAPIVRQGHVLGVLVVQNKARRIYDQDEVDALELVAMVIAEMADAGALFTEREAPSISRRGPVLLNGASGAEGVAMGGAVLHEPKILLANPIAEDVATERSRLSEAMRQLRGEVDRLVAEERLDEMVDGDADDEHRDVLQTYRLFAHDSGWLRRLEAAVDSGLSAEAAVEHVQNETQRRLERTADPYLRERLSDLDDLANRLLRTLLGLAPPTPEDLPENAILVARNLGPGELLDYARGRLRGLALEEGSSGGHAAIVARALNIPLAIGLRGLIDRVETGDPMIVDGDVGRVLVRPESSVVSAYRETIALKAQLAEQYRAIRDLPAETRDGARVRLEMNAGLLTDMPSLSDSGAEGVGLYRTELQYLINDRAPRREAQTRLYQRVFDAAGEAPVTFRTLDMGGDKRLPFLKGEAEENPALGWRAIRIALDRPLLFRMQLQSLTRAAAGRKLRVMFPMIATASEFYRARDLLLQEVERLDKQGRTPPTSIEVGAMLETPALAFAPDRFFEVADFISVGGNDLFQFFFAADRGNQRVRSRYDPLSTSFVNLLDHIVTRCRAAGVRLSFCGEMAARPVDAIALAALGFKTLSVRPAAIGPVKTALRTIELKNAVEAIAEAREEGAESVRPHLRAYYDREMRLAAAAHEARQDQSGPPRRALAPDTDAHSEASD